MSSHSIGPKRYKQGHIFYQMIGYQTRQRGSTVTWQNSKKIPEQLMEMILQQKYRPSVLLQEQNKLIKYLRTHCPSYIETAIRLFQNAPHFYLLKIGPYCAVEETNGNPSFLLFDRQLITYLCYQPGSDNQWGGFAYKKQKSVYIGEFFGDKAHGKGKGLFFQTDTIQHQFIGQWKDGAISKGNSKTCKDGELFIEYEGQFKDFQFHGKGIRTKKGKTVSGIFQDGCRMKGKAHIKQQDKSSLHESMKIEMNNNGQQNSSLGQSNQKKQQKPYLQQNNRQNKFNRESKLDELQ